MGVAELVTGLKMKSYSVGIVSFLEGSISEKEDVNEYPTARMQKK